MFAGAVIGSLLGAMVGTFIGVMGFGEGATMTIPSAVTGLVLGSLMSMAAR